MMRILSIHVYFVVQRSSADNFESAIFDLEGIKTGAGAPGWYACPRLANSSSISINSSESAMHIIDILLRHAGRADSPAGTRICVFYTKTMIAYFE